MKKRTRVLICNDYPLFREGIKAVLRKEPSIEVVGEAKNGREGVEMSLQLSPDVVILDISLPEISGLDAARRIKQANGEIKILMLTTHDEEELVLRCLDAGASAHVLKDIPPSQLIIALKTIDRMGKYRSPGNPLKIMPPPILRSLRTASECELLTEREREVLVLLAQGCTVKEIAIRLSLGTKTVDTHKYKLMRKLDIHNKTELIKYAIREKLISLDP
jgi:two-component system, NarL family, response regulator NreC